MSSLYLSCLEDTVATDFLFSLWCDQLCPLRGERGLGDGIKARCKDLVPDDKLEHILLTLELVPGWETSFYLFKTLSEHFLLDIFSLYHKYYKIS